MKHIFLVLILAIFAACANDSQPPLVASDVVVMETMPGMRMTAAYMTLTNNSRDAIRVTGVTSPDFAAVEVHETVIEDNVSRMRKVPELVVPPSGSVSLKPGGMHLMLMRPTTERDTVSLKLWSGDSVLLTLETGYTKR
jgi:copper(I)-binding protein